ncbi:MAG TPA: Fic family protein [Candidatus Baltobacteraceae bacterium]|nr:Fic family protein [Candidatus Baltobacteraceae bacterium]
MDIRQFQPQAPGRLVKISEGGHAFIPAPLPIGADLYTADLILALDEATAELGRLDGLAANLPDPELLIGPFLRREAVLSSRIEGTQTTYSDLVLFEAAEIAANTGDTSEVRNYISALKYGVRRAEEIPFGRQLILEIHDTLMASAEAKVRRGQFRDRQVFIAQKGLTIRDARYVPPPALEVEPLFDNLAAYLQAPNQLPLLIRLAITHYQFEAIHPFIDGNGRLGRLLIVLMLCKERRLNAPMLYLSAYFERRRQQYNDLMLEVSRSGAWTDWIIFFLRGVALQARDAIQRTRQLQALRQQYRDRFRTARTAASVLTLVDALFELPVLTNRRAQSILGFSWQAASENIQKLVDAQIVQRVDVPGRVQYFLATEIVEILDRAEAIPAEAPPEVSDAEEVTQAT